MSDHVGHVGSRCTPVHPEKELSKDDGLARVHRLNEVFELTRG